MVDLRNTPFQGARGYLVPVVAGIVAVGLALTAAPSSPDGRAPSLAGAPNSPAAVPSPGSTNADPLRLSLIDAATSEPARVRPDLAAISAVLDSRAAAVLARDLDAYVSTAAADDTGEARTQAEAIGALPIQQWSYSLGSVDHPEVFDRPATRSARARYGDGAAVVNVVLTYRIEGYDRSAVSTAHVVTVVEEAGGVRIIDDRPVDGSREIWDFGPITVITGTRSMVIGLGSSSPSTATLQQYADAADIGVRDVTQVWGTGWQRRVLLVAPPTTRSFASALGRDPANYRQIAAVTTADLGSAGAVSRGDRVFVNPDAFAKFGPRGRTIVLRHEITHVASTAASIDVMPTWMEEGFADYVGYRGAGVPRSTITRELAGWVGDGNRVRALPSDDAYDGRNPDLVVSYEQSWLACQMLVDRYGEDMVVDLYRSMRVYTTADPDDGTDRAFREVLGTSLAEFTRQWRAAVQSLGGEGTA